MSTARIRNSTFLDRLQPSTTTILIISAVVVGAGTGLGAVFFIKLISLVEKVFFVSGAKVFGFLGIGLFIIAPVVGGLLGGPVISFFAKEAKGHGVPEVMQAIALRGGRIRPRVVVAKVIASALCIGSGGSAGREGPIVQVGSALGSSIGKWLHLSEARLRHLDFWSLLPQINCRQCGEATCLAFAVSLIQHKRTLEECIPIQSDESFTERLMALKGML